MIDRNEGNSKCRGCSHPRDNPEGVGQAIAKLNLMTQNARQGCLTCSLFLDAIAKCCGADALSSGESAGQDLLVRFDFNKRGSKSLELFVFSCRRTIGFFTKTNSPPEESLGVEKFSLNFPRGFDIPPATSSPESIRWAREQLDKCLATHSKCSSQSGAPLPRRVLDIGRGDGDAVRLVQAEHRIEPYACLSYCWGKQPFLRTVDANLHRHLSEIPWDELPLTYRQAIMVARLLDLRYLWIDSLCIIQDSTEDWRREGAAMSSIYQGAHLVISAARASSVAEGLFSTVPPDLRNSHALATGNTHGCHDGVYARIRFAHINRPLPDKDEGLATLPIFARGWAFQERFLASRVLYFNAEELAWECLHESACQCSGVDEDDVAGPGYTPARRRGIARSFSRYADGIVGRTVQPKLFYNPTHWLVMRAAGEQGRRELRRCWRDLVEDFTALELSFESDIFPAISGLARRFGDITSGRYLAGLWSESLISDLCWHVSPAFRRDGHPSDTRGYRRPREWRAPSWSWASVTRPVEFLTVEGLSHACQVVDAECVRAGPDPTGQLTQGRIVLRGLLVPTEMSYVPRECQADDSPARPPPACWLIFDLGMLCGRLGNQYADYDSSLPGWSHCPAGSTVYCFLLGQCEPSQSLCFLVLRLVGESPQIYERLGLVELFMQQQGSKTGLDLIQSIARETVVKIE